MHILAWNSQWTSRPGSNPRFLFLPSKISKCGVLNSPHRLCTTSYSQLQSHGVSIFCWRVCICYYLVYSYRSCNLVSFLFIFVLSKAVACPRTPPCEMVKSVARRSNLEEAITSRILRSREEIWSELLSNSWVSTIGSETLTLKQRLTRENRTKLPTHHRSWTPEANECPSISLCEIEVVSGIQTRSCKRQCVFNAGW